MIASAHEHNLIGHAVSDVAVQRRLIVDALGARHERIVDEIVGTMHLQLPAYWRYRDHALESDLVAGVGDVLSIFVGHVRDDRPLWREEVAAIRGIAARRLRQRVPLPVLLEALSVSEDVGWTHVVDCGQELVSSPSVLAAVGELGSLLHTFCRFTRETMKGAYALGAETDSDAARREVLADLFGGPDPQDEVAFLDRARQAGVDLRAPHGILLVTTEQPRGERNQVSRAVAAIGQAIRSLLDVPVMSGGTPHATLTVASPRHLWSGHLAAVARIAADHGVVVLAMEPVRGVGELRGAYQRAARLLRVAWCAPDGAGLVVPGDLRIFNLLIDGVGDWRAFVDETIGPILRMPEDRRDVYLDTIRALGTTRGGKAAIARALDVHEKTVAHRVARLRALTGLDPDSPGDRMQLMLALTLTTLGTRAG